MTASGTNNRIAFVTGASRGIGAAAAKALAKAGAHVVACARTTGGLEALDDEIRQAGGSATLMPLDLLDRDAVDRIGPALFERFGRCDILIGNAGMLGTLGPVAHGDPKEWQRVFDLNVMTNFRLIRTLDPLLRASSAGRAVFVTTGESVVAGRAYWGAYGASKAALESMVRCYAQETEKTALRVNLLAPGAVRTRMRAQAKPGENPETLPAPEDIAPFFVDLASPACTRHGEVVKIHKISPGLKTGCGSS